MDPQIIRGSITTTSLRSLIQYLSFILTKCFLFAIVKHIDCSSNYCRTEEVHHLCINTSKALEE